MAKRSLPQTAASDAGTVTFGAQNWLLLAAGLVTIIAGYVLLAGGSTVAAPLLLVLGYVVLVPLGIIR